MIGVGCDECFSLDVLCFESRVGGGGGDEVKLGMGMFGKGGYRFL